MDISYSNIEPEKFRFFKIEGLPIRVSNSFSNPSYERFIIFTPPRDRAVRNSAGLTVTLPNQRSRYHVWLDWRNYGIPSHVKTRINLDEDAASNHRQIREFIESLGSRHEIGVNELLTNVSKFVKSKVKYDGKVLEETMDVPGASTINSLPDNSPSKQYYSRIDGIEDATEQTEAILEGGRGVCTHGGRANRTLIGILRPEMMHYAKTSAHVGAISHDATVVWPKNSGWTVLNSLSRILDFDIATQEQARDLRLG